jgi:histidine triad (HIT) family protein
LAFHDIHPAAPVHVLLIPKKHITSLAHASVEDQSVLGELMLQAAAVARSVGCSEEGYRVVLNTGEHGGQSVFHMHAHVIAGRQLSWPPG